MAEKSIKHIISIRDMSKKEILYYLKEAKKIEETYDKEKYLKTLSGKVLALLFFEPSTRTRLSFEAAAKRLGASVIGFSSSKGTSVEKGESLADTVKVISKYCDAIAIRHSKEGSARYISEIVDLPVINCGDGGNQHPTQTLLDLYTIWKHFGHLDNISVSLVGDLKYARTTRSLFYALAMFGAKINLVSPHGLEMSKTTVEDVLSQFNCSVNHTRDIKEAFEKSDVVYIVRIQKERFPDPQELARIEKSYRITEKIVRCMKPNSIILHPLPRVDEVEKSVDNLPQAKYFEQSANGIPIRMAILKDIMQ